MKKIIEKRRYWRRISALAVCIILIVTLTGPPGVQVAKARDEGVTKTAGKAVEAKESIGGKEASLLPELSPVSQDEPGTADAIAASNDEADAGDNLEDSQSTEAVGRQPAPQETPADSQAGQGIQDSNNSGAKSDQDRPSGEELPQAGQDKDLAGNQENHSDSGGKANEEKLTGLEKDKKGDLKFKTQGEVSNRIGAAANDKAARDSTASTFDIANGAIQITDGSTYGRLKVTQTSFAGTQSYDIAANSLITITGTHYAQEVTTVNNSNYNIVVNAPSADRGVNIRFDNLTITTYNYYLASDQMSVMDIRGSTKVNLSLSGKNVLTAKGGRVSCINVPWAATLIINGGATDSLYAEVKSAWKDSVSVTVGAAIGSKWGDTATPSNGDSGTIIIQSGNIEAVSGDGPGIGAGKRGIARNITIEGGNVKAHTASSGYAAPIGNGGNDRDGSDRYSGQHITITGGTVYVDAQNPNAAGIGGGTYGGGGNVTITGGVVQVIGKTRNGIGPGTGGDKDFGEFTTGSKDPNNKGNANPLIILAKTNGSGGFIFDHSYESAWQGVVFENKTGHVHGTPNITTSFTIEQGYTLYIDKGQGVENNNAGTILTLNGTLVNNGFINGGMTLIVSGTGVAENNGQALNKGTIQINPGGRLENGSNDAQGEAVLQNAAGSKLIVNGTINNYAHIKGPDTGSYALSGTGTVWSLPDIGVRVLDKAGAEVAPEVSGEGQKIVPLKYKESIQARAEVTGPLYETVGEWQPQGAGQIGFSLANESQSENFSTQSSGSQGKTFAVTSTAVTAGEGTLPWEGDKPLELRASLINQMGGGPAVGNKPSMGYLPTTSKALVQYPKQDPGVTAWPAASEVTDGQHLSDSVLSGGAAAQPGSFSFNNPGQEAVWREDGQTMYQVDYVPSDSKNYKTVSKDILVKVKAIPRTVIYDPQSGSFPGMTTGQTITKDNAKNRFPLKPAMMPDKAPVKDGFVFMGWYKDRECKEPWNMADPVTSDMTLYAGYAATDPDVGFIIPAKVAMVNDPGTGEAKGKGTIQVRAIESGSKGQTYPARVTVSTTPDVLLTGKKGLTRKAKVYKEDGSPYDGSAALMTFDFKNVPTENEKYDFWLGMPVDDPQRQADTYEGGMTLTFHTQTKP